MEYQTCSPLTAAAQMVMAALRAQYADRIDRRPYSESGLDDYEVCLVILYIIKIRDLFLADTPTNKNLKPPSSTCAFLLMGLEVSPKSRELLKYCV